MRSAAVCLWLSVLAPIAAGCGSSPPLTEARYRTSPRVVPYDLDVLVTATRAMVDERGKVVLQEGWVGERFLLVWGDPDEAPDDADGRVLFQPAGPSVLVEVRPDREARLRAELLDRAATYQHLKDAEAPRHD